MEKIDRLGWAAGVSCYTYGLNVGVRISAPELLDRVLERLPPGWEPGCSHFVDRLYSLKVGSTSPKGKVRTFHLLYMGLTRLARTMDLDEALDVLEGDLQMHVAEHAQNRVFVHAGVVGWKGRALLLPGRSLAGKSTLVAALLRAGATYYSDEYAVLDGRGMVHPFPRRLALRRAEGQSPRRATPAEFVAPSGTGPLPVGLVALTTYRPEANWRPAALTPGKAVLALLNHAIPAERAPDMVLNTLEKVAPDCRVLKGLRGDADATAPALLRAMEN